ncbi:LOW QUALITY PROTEIN: hypothetical protein GLYMA_10G091500v4 [Glycine max]|uniref:Uncharacterized protein n=1 Tax=Glycine max TaxID=3847 RepID=A0A0R0HYM8_SOYBN|nr:LOW QUALITY PROTEIN: hypothetical protein GLYMA_10G091500v4 [Glycine max]
MSRFWNEVRQAEQKRDKHEAHTKPNMHKSDKRHKPNKDFKGINPVNQDDLVVVSIVIENFKVSRVLIDQGSSTGILYWKTFQRLEASPNTVHLYVGPLLVFAGERVETRGYIDLMTTFGKLSRSFTITYLLVDANTSYFSLISRKTLNELGAIVSTPHLKMKFPTLTGGIVTIKADQKQARRAMHKA